MPYDPTQALAVAMFNAHVGELSATTKAAPEILHYLYQMGFAVIDREHTTELQRHSYAQAYAAGEPLVDIARREYLHNAQFHAKASLGRAATQTTIGLQASSETGILDVGISVGIVLGTMTYSDLNLTPAPHPKETT